MYTGTENFETDYNELLIPYADYGSNEEASDPLKTDESRRNHLIARTEEHFNHQKRTAFIPTDPDSHISNQGRKRTDSSLVAAIFEEETKLTPDKE